MLKKGLHIAFTLASAITLFTTHLIIIWLIAFVLLLINIISLTLIKLKTKCTFPKDAEVFKNKFGW
jgi:hypothetical protein